MVERLHLIWNEKRARGSDSHCVKRTSVDTIWKATTGKVLRFDNTIFSTLFVAVPTAAVAVGVVVAFKISPTPFSFWHTTTTVVCSHINFRICSTTYRWYATIFLLSLSFFTQFLLFFRSTHTNAFFFRHCWTCYMKGEMKCRSCTHVHARTT